MGETRWLSDLELRAWVNFLDTSRMLEEQVGQQLRREHGMSHLEYEILAMLSSAPDHRLRLSELAASVVASRPRLTYVIDQLAERGWVQRESVEGDARGFNAVLTDDGYAVLRDAAPGHVKTVRDFLVDWIPAGDLESFAATMETAARHLRGHRSARCCQPCASGCASSSHEAQTEAEPSDKAEVTV